METTTLPSQDAGFADKHSEKLLFLCYYDPAGISTITENIAFLQAKSRFPITVLNLKEHNARPGWHLTLDQALNIEQFAGIVIHNTVSYNVENLRALDLDLPLRFKDYRGAKILMKQDDNFRFREIAECMGEIGFDLVFTCLPDEALELVYPRATVGPARFSRMLTGYVTPTLRALSPSASRPIDIGYRGSIQPLSFGRLPYEKRKIGDDVARLLFGNGLKLDISSRGEDRLGSIAWFDFLRSCKATLGVESGASVFDLKGDLAARCRKAEEKLGPFREDHEYAEAFLAELADLEDLLYYNQISPRHFEAAATGTLQLLYPGNYSGILQSGRHFFPLRRDYGNLDDALELIRDEPRRKAITALAYEEIIQNPTWWIESFVDQFDREISQVFEAKDCWLKTFVRSKKPARNILLLASHELHYDPRLNWIEGGAPQPFLIHELGIIRKNIAIPRIDHSPRGALRVDLPIEHDVLKSWRKWKSQAERNPAGKAGIQELLFLEDALALDENAFSERFAAPLGSIRTLAFRFNLKYVLETTITLLKGVERFSDIHAVIACDMDTLLAALVVKGIFQIPVLYDAHEYWPDAQLDSLEFERRFWMEMERRMVAHADYRQVVSPGLAELMTVRYGCPFATVPNAEPANRALISPRMPDLANESCRFFFQGLFAVRRGLELLINAWPKTDPRAILQLQGPDNPYKTKLRQLAAETGLLNRRIFFSESVSEEQLIASAAKADIGLAPYEPIGANYQNCCPNKLSQYMAAGLPILGNRTNFVTAIIKEANCGRSVDFSDTSALVGAVNEMAADVPGRRLWAENSLQYFREKMNWEAVSAPLYEALKAHASGAPAPFLMSEPKAVLAPRNPLRRETAERNATGKNQIDSKNVLMIDRNSSIDRRIVLEAKNLRKSGHRVVLLASYGESGKNEHEIDGLPILRFNETTVFAQGKNPTIIEFNKIENGDAPVSALLQEKLSHAKDIHSQRRFDTIRITLRFLIGRTLAGIIATFLAPRYSAKKVLSKTAIPRLFRAVALFVFGILSLDFDLFRLIPTAMRKEPGTELSSRACVAKLQFEISRSRVKTLPPSQYLLTEYWRRIVNPRYGLDALRIEKPPLRIVPGIILGLLTFDPYIIKNLRSFALGKFPFIYRPPRELKGMPEPIIEHFRNQPLDLWEKSVLHFACDLDRVDAVHAHDLPALRVAVLTGLRRNIPVIYDSHELFSYQPGVEGERKRKLLNAEHDLIGYCDEIVVINSDQAAIMQRDHGWGSYTALTNATETPSGFDIRKRYTIVQDHLSLPEGTPTMLFMGGVNRFRKIHLLLEGLALSSRRVHIVFLTWDKDVTEFKQLAERLDIAERIHFVDPVPWYEVLYWAASVDAGMIPYQANDLNTRICSPNKMYEFIAAGTPMIGSSELINVERVVSGEGFGVTLPLHKAKDYAKAIDTMFDPILGGPTRFRPTILEKAHRYSWNEQARDFSSMYERLWEK